MDYDTVDLEESRIDDALDFCVSAGTQPEHIEAQRQDSGRWLRQLLREWNPCGKMVYMGGEAKGLILYLPAASFTGRSLCKGYKDNDVEFPASWSERGVVGIACFWVKATGRGIGGGLLRAVIEELSRGREFRGAACGEIGVMVDQGCGWPAGPADLFRKFGFEVEQSDPATNRVWLTRVVRAPAVGRRA